MRARVPFAIALAAAALSCDAALETACRDGECTSTSGAGGGAACVPEETKGLPCDVHAVLAARCHGCHGGKGPGPFPLLSYDDTQAIYSGKVVWQRMRPAVSAEAEPPQPRMPLGDWPLPKEQLDVLEAWFATCEAGECARLDGTGGAGGGAGGAGGGAGGGGGGADTGGAGAGGAGGGT